jgi:hypothetical protein
MNPAALALLASAAFALICACVVYVARLHFDDRERARGKVESKHTAELEALRARVISAEKTAREAHTIAAAKATARIRN